MKKKYELVVKGINNYPDKITVTVALEIGGYPSLLLPDVAISLDRTEGATLEFYEAEAKKQAKQFFMDVAAGLCEGDGPLPEKRPIILEAQDVLITYRGKLPGIITGIITRIRLLLLWHWKLVGIRHCCCQMWRLVLTVLKVPRWSFTKLRRKSRRSSFSWMLLPGYVKGMVRCRKSGPSF